MEPKENNHKETRPLTYITDELGMTTPMTDDQEILPHDLLDPKTYENLYQALLTMVKATDDLSNSFCSELDPKTLIIIGDDLKAFTKKHRTVRFGLGPQMAHKSLGLQLCRSWAPNASLFLTDAGWVSGIATISPLLPTRFVPNYTYPVSVTGLLPVTLESRLNSFKLIVVDKDCDLTEEGIDNLMGLTRPTKGDLGPLWVLLQ